MRSAPRVMRWLEAQDILVLRYLHADALDRTDEIAAAICHTAEGRLSSPPA